MNTDTFYRLQLLKEDTTQPTDNKKSVIWFVHFINTLDERYDRMIKKNQKLFYIHQLESFTSKIESVLFAIKKLREDFKVSLSENRYVQTLRTLEMYQKRKTKFL